MNTEETLRQIHRSITGHQNIWSPIKCIIQTYIDLQVMSQKEIPFAIRTDGLRGTLRNQLSQTLRMEPRVIQEWVEQEAHKILHGQTKARIQP
jgi:hypothetical protein